MQSNHEKVYEVIDKNQGQTSPRIVKVLGMSRPVVNKCIAEMIASGKLTKKSIGKSRILFTTEYIVENGIPVVAESAYSKEAVFETPTLDLQMLFNRLMGAI